MTSSHPLQLPEILSSIFACLWSNHDELRSAMLVNHTWFEEATSVLWSFPRPVYLIKIPAVRRQLYASKIEELSFDGDEDNRCHFILKDLTFPRLKRVSLDAYRLPDGIPVPTRQYLQQSLESLCVFGGNLIEDLLDFVFQECRRLQSITIDNISGIISPKQFLHFLQSTPSSTSLCFLYGMDHVIVDETLVHLMTRQNLTDLKIDRYFGKDSFERAISEASTPIFHSLRWLRMRTDSNALALLVPILGNVVTLEMAIDDDKGPILRQLSSLDQLGVLSVEYCRNQDVSRADILSLRNLHKLHELSLRPWTDEVDDLRTSDFTDEDLEQLVSQLNKLRNLTFSIQSNITVKALDSIGKHCRKLQGLEMLGTYDVQALRNSEETLFPSLVELELGGASFGGAVEQYVQLGVTS